MQLCAKNIYTKAEEFRKLSKSALSEIEIKVLTEGDPRQAVLFVPTKKGPSEYIIVNVGLEFNNQGEIEISAVYEKFKKYESLKTALRNTKHNGFKIIAENTERFSIDETSLPILFDKYKEIVTGKI